MRRYMFNQYGLRFDSNHLRSMLMSPEPVKSMSREELAEYVDAVTWSHCRDGKIYDLFEVSETEMQNLNMTGIGNVAYLSLYHPDDAQRSKALRVLQSILTKL